ncbi:MAG: hypothetical protein QW660_08565 [Candidatus Bathyarchaeia archaeon]
MISMSKCPNCKKENPKPSKTWKYGIFTVKVYTCSSCKTEYRDYLDKKWKNQLHPKTRKRKSYRKA